MFVDTVHYNNERYPTFRYVLLCVSILSDSTGLVHPVTAVEMDDLFSRSWTGLYCLSTCRIHDALFTTLGLLLLYHDCASWPGQSGTSEPESAATPLHWWICNREHVIASYNR